jgi:hypothetical protein
VKRIITTAALLAARFTSRGSSPRQRSAGPETRSQASLLAATATKLTFKHATKGFLA